MTSHPGADFGDFEPKQSPNAMDWKLLRGNPPVDRFLRYAEVRRYALHADPVFSWSHASPCLKRVDESQ